ncbi:MAG: tripartite tricarboxylate transporter substrate-binding protein [Beijerinckiaceae bacterium]|nr:tripartite tricarboxylate transporter substrate-binding protein [Beijerinckiaceae bacterium]
MQFMHRTRLEAALLAMIAFAAFVSIPGPQCLSGGAAHASEDPFYKGKRINLLINYAAGGPTDIEGRLFARFLSRHIDGQPSIIVQNMDGAGGLIGTNYLGEVAPRDGTAIGYLSGATWRYIHDRTPRRVDFKSFEFLAYQPGTTVYFARSDIKPGLKVATDIVKAQGVISGGLGADNAKDLLLRLTLDMLGVKYKYVTGYRGSQAARLALQQGEINYYAESPPSYRGMIEPTLVRSGEVIPIFYDPSYDGETFRTPRQMQGVDMMSFPTLYETIHGRAPSGELWDVYRSIIAVNGAMQRLIVMPPEAPPEAIRALSYAIDRLNADADYAQEGERLLGYVPEFIVGPEVNGRVRRQLSISPSTRDFLEAYVKNAPR